jgi:hypothetical protein
MATTFTGHYPSGLFYGGMLRTKCIRHQFQALTLARIRDARRKHGEKSSIDVLRATNGPYVEVY